MDVQEKQLIQILIKHAGIETDTLPAQNLEALDENSQILLTALEEEHIITRCPDEEIQEPDSLSHGQIGSYYFSPKSLINISSLSDEFWFCVIAASLNSDIRTDALHAVLIHLLHACRHLTENEREVLNQFRAQAQKINQSKYDAGIPYKDLKKGFDPDGTIPFDKTLDSLLTKGILVKSSEDYYHLIR